MVWNILKMLSVSVINLKYHNKDHKDFTSHIIVPLDIRYVFFCESLSKAL